MNFFLESITPNVLDKNNKISSSKLLWYFRKNPIEKQKLFDLTPKCEGQENFMERIFWIKNNLTDYLVCANPSCNNKLKGIAGWKIYKYPIDCNKSKHRICCCNKCKHELHSARTNEVNVNRVKTMKSKYGVTSAAHLDTNLFKIDNPMQHKKIVEKVKNTCLEKYGVDNPSKSKKIMNKIIKKGYGAKDYTFPSGKIVKIRGYEWKALNDLLKQYSEYEIEVSTKKIPKIKYYWKDNSEHYYFPDVYIKKNNLLIEVKSTYYMEKDFDKNMSKKAAAIEAGYSFDFMVYDSKLHRIEY